MNQIKNLFAAQKFASAVMSAFMLFTFFIVTAISCNSIKPVAGSEPLNQPSNTALEVQSACKKLNLSGSWLVTVEVAGTTAIELRTSKHRWEFTDLGDCKWSVKMSNINNTHSVEKTFTSLVEGEGKLRFKNPEMTDMIGTYGQSQFSVAHKMHDVNWTYSGKKE